MWNVPKEPILQDEHTDVGQRAEIDELAKGIRHKAVVEQPHDGQHDSCDIDALNLQTTDKPMSRNRMALTAKRSRWWESESHEPTSRDMMASL